MVARRGAPSRKGRRDVHAGADGPRCHGLHEKRSALRCLPGTRKLRIEEKRADFGDPLAAAAKGIAVQGSDVAAAGGRKESPDGEAPRARHMGWAVVLPGGPIEGRGGPLPPRPRLRAALMEGA